MPKPFALPRFFLFSLLILLGSCTEPQTEVKKETQTELKTSKWLFRTLAQRNQEYRSRLLYHLEKCEEMLSKKPTNADTLFTQSKKKKVEKITRGFNLWRDKVLKSANHEELIKLKKEAFTLGHSFVPGLKDDSLHFVEEMMGENLRFGVLSFGQEMEMEALSDVGRSFCCLYERDKDVGRIWLLRNNESGYFPELDSIKALPKP